MTGGILLFRKRELVAALAAVVLGFSFEDAGATVITNAGSGDWFATGTWTGSQVPGSSDDAVISSGTVLLTNETDQLASFKITGGTLTMSNWTTRLRATTVTITNTATITLPPAFTNTAMSNRVWIACTDFTLGSGAKIDVNGKGWAGATGLVSDAGHGPGAGLVRKAAA